MEVTTALLLIAATTVLAVGYQQWQKIKYPMPPGPKGVPIMGNALQMGVPAVWKQFKAWSVEYESDVIGLNVFGTPIIVLNSLKSVNDVLNGRSSYMSDRPELPMIKDLMGWDFSFAFKRYGNDWREHRRVFMNHFTKHEIQHEIQIAAAQHMLKRLAQEPDEFMLHLHHYTGSIILKRVYGYTAAEKNDPLVQLTEAAGVTTSTAASPPGFFVDVIPQLKYRLAREWRKLSTALVNEPYEEVKRKMTAGTAEPCFVSSCLEDSYNDQGISEKLIKSSAAVAYAAGVDTTSSTLTSFIYAMVKHPDVQRRCHEELDAVIGGNRLPEYSDRENLPFLTAVVKESLRWIPVFPLAIPHRAMKGERYGDYYIPKDATVMGNTWAIFHDEKTWKRHDEFLPERFMEQGSEKLPDPLHIAFGYGRRTCGGKEMALDTIWLGVAYILTSFSIHKAKDAQGKEIEPQAELEPGLLCHLKPFKCHVEVRKGREWATAL
ncbi:cytochrome P450 [Hymenopellis radicata]|nr:cytochrome P450 [Hymenopellis radicata]